MRFVLSHAGPVTCAFQQVLRDHFKVQTDVEDPQQFAYAVKSMFGPLLAQQVILRPENAPCADHASARWRSWSNRKVVNSGKVVDSGK